MSYFRTAILLAALTALFMGIGFLIGGQSGMIIALLIAGAMNLFTYWNADKMVLSMYGAHEVDERQAPELYALVRQLAANAGLPMPRVCIMENPQPNAFATGRNREHAAVAVTTGLMQMVNRDELAGVLAHELGHVKHRDTLLMTLTATIAGAISMLANFGFYFGGARSNNNNAGLIGSILLLILGPLAAGLVQMAISRTREYEADRGGAQISGDPLALASALAKISNAAGRTVNVAAERNPAMAHLYIFNPLRGVAMDNLFATHPSVENRIAALQKMAGNMADRPGPVHLAFAEPSSSSAWRVPEFSETDRTPPRGPWG